MRELRARLVGQRLAEDIRLPRPTSAQTAAMTSAALGRPVPAPVLAAIHARSDGIPLHVEELLAAVGQDALDARSGAAVQAATVPDTLADAVLSRAWPTSCGREVGAAAAVIGRSFDFDLLTAVTLVEPDDVAMSLRELRDASFVLPGPDAVTFDFRHALIRDTLYAGTDLPLRRRLHERVARAAAERGYRDAFVSAQFERAGCPELAFGPAVAAAREAVSLCAHGEALELYRRAVRCLPEGLAPLDRAALLAAFADEAAAADDNTAAAEAYWAAHELATDAGDVRAAAALAPRLAAVHHLLGERLEARAGALLAALGSLDGVDGADRERARLLSALAAAYMLSPRLDQAIDYGYRAAAATPAGGDETALGNAATLGPALLFAGRMDEGWRLLEDTVARARGAGWEAEAARAYRMIGTASSVLGEYDRASRWLTEGIGYAERAELWNHRHYMAVHLAHVHWCTGAWDAAGRTARYALADGRGGLTTQITAQYVLGYLAVGRGHWEDAAELLAAALAQGEQMAELQRLSPPLWGMAEAARCQDDPDTAVSLCERGFLASAEVNDAAYLFPYLLTGVRAHLARGDTDAAAAWVDRVAAVLSARAIPVTLPVIGHGRGLVLLARGDAAAAAEALEAASAAWRAIGRFWEGTWARLDLAAAAANARRPGAAAILLDEVRAVAAPAGAAVLIAAADRIAASLGAGRTVDPWYPLSAREFEVAQLVAAGLTNREIAARLFLAPKTISAHIAHILAKLGAARRTEIAAWCATIHPGQPPNPG